MKRQLLLLLIAHVLVTSVAAETLYVTPEYGTVACHDHSSADQVLPCFTLSQYASNASSFTSNTTLILLPGNHVLDSNPLFITNITLLEVLASSAKGTQISCNNSSGFSFDKIGTVYIRRLSFIGCDRNKVMVVENFLIEDSIFDGQGGSSSGLDLVDVTHANITTCSFISNVAAERLVLFTHPFNRFSAGGAMYISNSSVHVWSSFFNNSTAHYGGAVYIVNGHLALHNSEFSDNSATGSPQLGTGRGGAVYIVHYSTINITNGNIFNRNTATGEGGAVYNIRSSVLVVNDGNVFINNRANYGGALYNIHNSTMDVVDNNTFRNNTSKDGGAIYNTHQSTTTIVGGSTFIYNQAVYGGAIYNVETSVITIADGNVFTNNEASFGGAVYNRYRSNITVNEDNTFSDNRATYGGAMYNYGEKSGIHVSDNNMFSNNTASECGGAVLNTGNGTLTITGDNTFINNSAECGGAVLNFKNSRVMVADGNMFIGNTAPDGGAVLNEQNSILVILYKNTFIDNRASGHGGAIGNVDSSKSTIYGVNTFTDNSALFGGGVYNTVNSTLTITDGNTFSDNIADDDGGAVLNDRHSIVEISDSNVFSNNVAFEYGGAVLNIGGSTTTVTNNNTFTNNKATNGGGGALFCEIFSSITITDSNTFSNNSAYSGGGAVYNAGEVIINHRNTISSNVVIAGHGGAIYNGGRGSLTISDNNTLESNTAAFNGGALYISRDSISVTVSGRNKFVSNNAIDGGALYNDEDTTIRDSNEFFGNVAESDGGAIYNRKNLKITNGNTLIANTASNNGGAVYSTSSKLRISDSNEFNSNVAHSDGGAVWTETSMLAISENNIFTNNTAMMSGGSMVFRSNALTIFTQNNMFIQNRAMIDGGAIVVENSVLTLSENNTFISNTALDDGGAMAVMMSVLTISHSCGFIANEAQDGGALSVSSNSEIIFTTDSDVNFVDNQADRRGGGTYLSGNSTIDIHGHVNFACNKALSGGGVNVHSSYLNIMGNVTISYNRAESNGGGISSVNSNMNLLTGYLQLTENSAVLGGGVYLTESYIVYLVYDSGETELKNHTEMPTQRNGTIHIHQVILVNNTAEYGGAIFFNDSSIPETCTSTRSSMAKCFLQVPQLQSPEHNQSTTQQNYFHFSNNNAEVAGPALYGGLLDRCTLSIGTSDDTMEVNTTDHYFRTSHAAELIKEISNLTEEETKSLITSNAVRVCFCVNGQPDCSHQPPPIYIFQGRKIMISLAAVDQVNNIVSAIIHASLTSTESGSIFGGQLAQNVSKTCNNIEYNITSSESTETVLLYADGPCEDKGISERQIQVNFIPCTCPVGFEPSSSQVSCECECHRDLPYVTNCFRDSGKLERKSDFWIGVSNKTDANDTTFISVPFCPYDFCHPATESVLVNLNDPNGSDAQCAFNRSGKVCGSCKDGLSLVFGSSRCKPCSNHYLALLIPFAIAGIVLVVFLIVCNLTVAVGTINGLIFYANIATANRVVFFPHGATSFFTVAISWISLNLGIETCFYDGMDAYAKMWLQFAFDIYLIVLVICIIIACKYTNTFARVLYGKNPVATLATLILLSYEKLSRKLFSLLAFATIDHTDGLREGVWLFDPNLPYLRGKHIALLIMFIVIFMFGCAFNGLLLFGQCLPHLPRQKIFQWVRNTKFSAFLDAYHAPYNPKHRYWVGLLLLVRVILYLILEVNAAGDARINLLSVVSAGVGLLLLKHLISGRVYNKRSLDVLETTFIVNLIMFAAATLFARQANGNQTAIAYTSFTIILLVMFLGILTYHTYKYALKYTTTKKYLKRLFKATKGSFMSCFRANDMKDCDTQMTKKKTATVVKNLKEPLNLITHAPTTGEYRLAEPKTPPNHHPAVTCTEIDIPPNYAIPLTHLMGHDKSPDQNSLVIHTASPGSSPGSDQDNEFLTQENAETQCTAVTV